MKIGELIKELQSLDPELNVFVSGYEGGYDDIIFNNTIRDIVLNYYDDSKWWMGAHEQKEDVSINNEKETVKGIIL